MPSIHETKSFGEVGAILVLFSGVPQIGWLLGIIGFILILLAVRDIAKIFKDPSIFNNMLVSIVLAIAGTIVGGLVIVGAFFQFIGQTGLSGKDIFGRNFNPSTVPSGDWIAFISAAIAGLAVIWIFFILSAIFVRRSYSSMATKLNAHMFATAGLLYLIGAVTTIILVGFLLILVAQILLIIAFFSIDERALEAQIPKSV